MGSKYVLRYADWMKLCSNSERLRDRNRPLRTTSLTNTTLRLHAASRHAKSIAYVTQ